MLIELSYRWDRFSALLLQMFDLDDDGELTFVTLGGHAGVFIQLETFMGVFLRVAHLALLRHVMAEFDCEPWCIRIARAVVLHARGDNIPGLAELISNNFFFWTEETDTEEDDEDDDFEPACMRALTQLGL